jgi:hypothetical protein
MYRFLFVVVIGLFTSVIGAVRADVYTWTGAVSNDWNTAGNWSSDNPGTFPNSPTAVVNFTSPDGGTVDISSSVQAQSLTFDHPTGDFTLTSSGGQILSGLTAITVTRAVTGTASINLANVPTGSLLFGSSGSNTPLTIINNNSNPLMIGPSTVIGALGSGGVTVTGPGATEIAGSFASGPNRVAGGLTVTDGHAGFTGDGSNLGGGLTVVRGQLDLPYRPNPASKLSDGSLTLSSGTLGLGPYLELAATDTIPGGTNVAAGHSSIVYENVFVGGEGLTFNLGAITRAIGGMVDFNDMEGLPPLFLTTTTGNTNGLLGSGPAFATFGGGWEWAADSGGVITRLSTYGDNMYSPGINTDVTTLSSSPPANFTTNSLRINTLNATLMLSGVNTLQSGGILVTPWTTVGESGTTIAGGTLTAAGSGELLVHNYGGRLTINSNLLSSTGLTVVGDLILGGNNTGLTGPINVNGGKLTVTSAAAVNSASQINFNSASADQTFTISPGWNPVTILPSVRLSGNTTFDTGLSHSRVALDGVISSAAGATTPITFDGRFDLNAANTFTGDITVSPGGELRIQSNASLGNPANTMTLGGGSNPYVTVLTLGSNGINVTRPVVINSRTQIYVGPHAYGTISGPISGPGTLRVSDWEASLTLSNPSNSFSGGVEVSFSTLAIQTDGALGASSGQVDIVNGGTLRYTGSTATSRTFNVHNGTINLGGHVLDLNGGLLVNNGTVRSGTVNVNDGSTAKGTGSYDAVHVTDGGVFAPGDSVGFMTANSVSFDTGSSLSIELAGAAPAQYDQLHVSGRLSLGGTLDVSLISPFTPQAGDSFDILDWGSLSRTIDYVTLPELGPELLWNTSQLYINGALTVTIAGDFNGDGSVDAADYVVWRQGLDTTYTLDDYNAWRAHFGQTVGSGEALVADSLARADAAIPEPGALWLALLGAAIIALKKRKGK